MRDPQVPLAMFFLSGMNHNCNKNPLQLLLILVPMGMRIASILFKKQTVDWLGFLFLSAKYLVE